MTTFEYLGPYEEAVVPTVGLVKQGDAVELPPHIADGANPEQFKKTNKKAAKAATTDTPEGEEASKA